MAHILRLTSSAFSSISFTSGTQTLLEYVPTAGLSEIFDVTTETISFMITGANTAAISAVITSINAALELAERRYDTGRGERVYIEFQPENYTAAYRAELVRERPGSPIGMLTFPPETLGWPWGTLKVEVQFVFTRANAWEASAETELSLSNGGGSGTGGRVIYNYHTAAVFSGITVSFDGTLNRISDSGNGFGIFEIGDVISLRGSTINDGIYTVKAVDAGGAYIDVNELAVSDEPAGDTVVIYDIQDYVHIDSAAIAGDLPARCRVELTNTDAGDALETTWIGQNYLASPEAFPHILEIGDSNTGSDSVDATSASGIKRVYAIAAAEAKVTGWTLPSAMLTSASGGYFKVLCRFAAATNITAVKWRLKLLFSGTVIWQGGQVQFDDTYAAISTLIREIDTAQLPPFVPENSAPMDLVLELWGIRTGGAIDVNIDCLKLLALDGYRKLYSLNGIAQNAVLKDDGVTSTYYQDISSKQVRDISPTGKQLVLWPGVDNRIYFALHSIVANTADRDRAASVRIYYRPRRITL